MLSKAWSRSQICAYFSEKYGLTERSTDYYIKKARDKLLEDAEMERPAWVAEALQRLRTYEQAAAAEKQNQTAINAVQAAAKLIGIDL